MHGFSVEVVGRYAEQTSWQRFAAYDRDLDEATMTASLYPCQADPLTP